MKRKLLDLFKVFFFIGLTTFGGGYAMISQIKDQVVDKKGWLSNDELLEICAIAESTPGPIAINLATYVGFKRAGILGGAIATIGVCIPSFVIIYILSFFLDKFLANKYVAYAFVGVKCGVAFLLIKVSLEMLSKISRTWWEISLFVIITLCMVGFSIFSISFSVIYYLIIAAVLGIFILSIQEARKSK